MAWLDLETRLIERLRGKLAAKIHVLAVRDLAGVVESQQQVPAVWVTYSSYTPADEHANGAVQNVELTWTVVVAVRNSRSSKASVASQGEAGPIMDAVLAALLGWRPGAPYSALRLTSPVARAEWNRDGFGYHPLSFTTRLAVRGESQRP